MDELNRNIKRLRRERGLTLEELGQKVGTSRQTIQRYESGQITTIPYDKIILLAKALGVTPPELMGWKETDRPPAEPTESGEHEWYLDPGAAAIAQEIFDNPELRVLFDAAKDVKPEDLRVVQGMIDALRRKEQG